jgi:hypothetical protein
MSGWKDVVTPPIDVLRTAYGGLAPEAEHNT